MTIQSSQLCCFLVTELTEAFMESSSKSIRCSALQYVYDIRKWLSPHIDEVHNHLYLMYFSSEGGPVLIVKCSTKTGLKIIGFDLEGY